MREVLIEFMDGTKLRLELEDGSGDFTYGATMNHYVCTISRDERIYVPAYNVKHIVVRDIKKEVYI